MGAGTHGGFGHTKGSRPTPRFTRIQYEGTVKVGDEVRDVSRRIYKRNDIDFEYISPETGLSNLDLMRSGRPPIGNDGFPVQLHHVLQKESGPMVEIRETTHEEYARTLHGLGVSGASFRRNPVLYKQYTNFRGQYWKWRVRQYEKGKR